DVGFLVLDAIPYAIPPSGGVNYVPTDIDQQVTWDRSVDIMEVYLNPFQQDVSAIKFIEETDTFFLQIRPVGVYLIDENNNFKLAARHTFSSAEPDHYPKDANFGAAQVTPRHHYDAATKKFHFSSRE